MNTGNNSEIHIYDSIVKIYQPYFPYIIRDKIIGVFQLLFGDPI
jgi:hypothetical protein